MIYNMFMFFDIDISLSLIFFSRTSESGLNFDNFVQIAHMIAKSEYFSKIKINDSYINSLSSNISFVEVGFILGQHVRNIFLENQGRKKFFLGKRLENSSMGLKLLVEIAFFRFLNK